MDKNDFKNKQKEMIANQYEKRLEAMRQQHQHQIDNMIIQQKIQLEAMKKQHQMQIDSLSKQFK